MQTDHGNINQFDTNERYDYTPKSCIVALLTGKNGVTSTVR